MDYKFASNTAKFWDAMSNNTVRLDMYYNNPQLFDFIMNLDESKMLIFRIIYLLVCFLVIRSIIRACMDPFSIKLHKKISELEDRLEEYDGLYQDLFFEKKILLEKLEAANARINSDKPWYQQCSCETGHNFLHVKRRKV